jgi:bifunctional DNase/RNase
MIYKEAMIDSVRYASINGKWVTILKRTEADDYLPIYMNAGYANLIRNELIVNQHDDAELFERFIVGEDVSGWELKYLLIDEVEGKIRARLLFEKGGSLKEIECPIAGAIALAFRKNARIIADQDIFYSSVPDPFLYSLLAC